MEVNPSSLFRVVVYKELWVPAPRWPDISGHPEAVKPNKKSLASTFSVSKPLHCYRHCLLALLLAFLY